MRKLRILHVTESSYLNSGYSTYSKALQQILFDSGKYEIAELACYDDTTHPGRIEIPWKIYSNMPQTEAERVVYQSNIYNQFGQFKFNETVLDFHPDIVFSCRDHWMDEHIERSPFRPMYNWVVMPTVDAEPQNEQWLATYATANAVFSYTDWGADVLRREGGGLINVVGAAPPGAESDLFIPMDKITVRRKFGIREDSLIVGTINRNQSRKLFPDLVDAFALFLHTADTTLAEKTYLHLHTSYPDMGWDIPKLIKQSGISHKILVTYRCRKCGHVSIHPYGDARAICHSCNVMAAGLPTVRNGVDRNTLAEIMNTYDVYVQYANSEGFGMGQVEAASAGIPVFSTDYSAMSDVVRKVNGFPIKVASRRLDVEFGCYRATPCNTDFVMQLTRFLSLSPDERSELGRKAREGVLTHYTWPQTAKRWMDVFDSLPLREDWGIPSRAHKSIAPPSEFPTNESMVKWCLTHYLGRPDLVGSYMETRLIRDLNLGYKVASAGGSYQNEHSVLANPAGVDDFDENTMLAELDIMRNEFTSWENRRCP